MNVSELNELYDLHDCPIDRLRYDRETGEINLYLTGIMCTDGEQTFDGRLSFTGVEDLVPDSRLRDDFRYLDFSEPVEGGEILSVHEDSAGRAKLIYVYGRYGERFNTTVVIEFSFKDILVMKVGGV